MSHPSLGKPPRSQTAGFPVGAARLRESRSAVAARALEVAIDADRSIRGRYDDAGLRNLLRDTEVLTERLALCVAGDDPYWLTEFADQTAPVFRRRGVPMDDAIRLLEGIRLAARGVLSPEEQVPADTAIDEASKVYRWYRQLAGDARKKNSVLAALYKGIGW